MKIKFKTKLGLATDKDGGRYATDVAIVSKEGLACASDGRILAIAKVEIEGEGENVAIHRDCLPVANADLKAEVVCEDDRTERHHPKRKTIVGTQPKGRYPQVLDCLPSVDEDSHLVVTINAAYLWNLAQAIGDRDVVTLLVPKKTETVPECRLPHVRSAIAVVAMNEEQETTGVGCIMPCSPSEHDLSNYRELARDTSLAEAIREYRKKDEERVAAELKAEREKKEAEELATA